MNGFASLGRQPRFGPPYPGWPREQIAIVEDAIREAIRRILADKSAQDIATAQENDITEWLEDQLCCLLNTGVVSGFDSKTFEQPNRDASTVNFNGKKISKKPDLAFKRLSHVSCARDTRQDAWFCECKILDDDSSHGLPAYIKKGLMRFVDGDYAWAMPEAQMIGYIRHGAGKTYAPANQLSKHFMKEESETGQTYVNITGLLREESEANSAIGFLPIYATTHGRVFPLPNKCPPGPITLRHLWFQMV